MNALCKEWQRESPIHQWEIPFPTWSSFLDSLKSIRPFWMSQSNHLFGRHKWKNRLSLSKGYSCLVGFVVNYINNTLTSSLIGLILIRQLFSKGVGCWLLLSCWDSNVGFLHLQSRLADSSTFPQWGRLQLWPMIQMWSINHHLKWPPVSLPPLNNHQLLCEKALADPSNLGKWLELRVGGASSAIAVGNRLTTSFLNVWGFPLFSKNASLATPYAFWGWDPFLPVSSSNVPPPQKPHWLVTTRPHYKLLLHVAQWSSIPLVLINRPTIST